MGSSAETWKLECNTEVEKTTKNNAKTNKKSKRLQFQGETGIALIIPITRKKNGRWSNQKANRY